MTVITDHMPLTKVRDVTIVVKVSGLAFPRFSDAEWSTAAGHVVYRTAGPLDFGVEYWVKDLTGRWTLRDTLDEARQTVRWLREHDR